ncbi:MAG: hypothetical protein ACRCVT_02105 [Leadbetterella sp.]
MRLIVTSGLLFFAFFSIAQTKTLRINPTIALPKDSVESKKLTVALNDFLESARKPNEENNYVYEAEKVETFILLDEVNGLEKSGRFKDDFFYKPYLTNVMLLNDSTYHLQVSYIGVNENTPLLRASFVFIAHKTRGSFTFSSPLLRNTATWKVLKKGNHYFHYQNLINVNNVKDFVKQVSVYDSKLKIANKTSVYYITDNTPEVLKLIGVDYKSDYQARPELNLSSHFANKNLKVFGSKDYLNVKTEAHDLFHDRLSLIVPRSKVNKPVDEGCAYLYGGSWGFSWEEIFKSFKDQIASNKTTDWADIKEKAISFKTGEYPNSADYIINALIVKKIEKEKGFAGVWELLNVGPFEKGNEKYYQILEKLTGISKTNYNQKIWELIYNEK